MKKSNIYILKPKNPNNPTKNNPSPNKPPTFNSMENQTAWTPIVVALTAVVPKKKKKKLKIIKC